MLKGQHFSMAVYERGTFLAKLVHKRVRGDP